MDNKTQILISIDIDENEIKEVIKIAQRVGFNSAKLMNEFASDLLGDQLEILSIDNGKPCGCT